VKVSRHLGKEMPKPDLKGKYNKDHPTVRIKLECDRRVTVLPHTFNSSVTNLLNKTDS
jgi:hypothetical protein